jgi:hypothetical protein
MRQQRFNRQRGVGEKEVRYEKLRNAENARKGYDISKTSQF